MASTPRDVREGGLRAYATIGHVTVRPRSFTIIQKFAGPPRAATGAAARGAGETSGRSFCGADRRARSASSRSRGAYVARARIDRASRGSTRNRSEAAGASCAASLHAAPPGSGRLGARVTQYAPVSLTVALRSDGSGRPGRPRDQSAAQGPIALRSAANPLPRFDTRATPHTRTTAVRDFAHDRQTARESRPAR